MIIKVTRRTALLGLSAFVAVPVQAQQGAANRSRPDGVEFAVLEKPAVFEIGATSGSLKETIQKGQELTWRRKEQPNDGIIQLTNISVGFLRSETGGELRMAFACNISSLGYRTAEDAKLNVIVRTKGGAALHASDFFLAVKCADKDQTVPPQSKEIPKDIAANVFNNVSSVEIAEYAEPNAPGLKVQRCG